MILVYTIFIAHWLFDFVLQTSYQGLNKSKSLLPLLSHVSIYSLGMSITFFIVLYTIYYSKYILASEISLIFFIITFICHFITDFFTSKITSKRYTTQHYYGWNGFWFRSIITYTTIIINYILY